MKLKTLKDIKEMLILGSNAKEYDKRIKQEAIKWYKVYTEDSGAPEIKEMYFTARLFIEEFFNLTEEDLEQLRLEMIE